MYQRKTGLWWWVRRPIEIPACWLKRSPSEGRGGGALEAKRGERELSSPLPRLHPPPHRHLLRIRARREFPPPASSRSPGWHSFAFVSTTFVLGTVGLPPHRILRQGNPMRGTARVPKTLHKNEYALKKQKLEQEDESELEQTHPGADDPFP
jgi:hypothetical protein